jgi:cell division septation protein DedD
MGKKGAERSPAHSWEVVVASSHRAGTSFSSGADRWLVLAGAGLLVLGLVLRLLTDIGRSTATGDTVAPGADTAVASAPAVAATDSAALAPSAAESTAAASLGATSDPRERAEPSPAAIPASRPTRAPAPAVAPPVEPAAVAPVASLGGWRVQLGVFGQVANAEKLKRQVEALGYRGEITPVGERLRVRAVGLADEPAARAAADSIAAALGVRGSPLPPGR